MNFRAAAFEMNLVHQVTNEVDTAAMILMQVLTLDRVGKQPGIESRAQGR